MGGTTDELLDLAHRMSPDPKPRAVDMLISVGERISCALAEMAIEDMGRHAISLTGSQAGIVTDTVHGKATIVDVRAWRVHEALDAGRIVLVAGFQGVSTEREVTTLGRGGSNLTAVALAASLGADVCEMYTDVEGVFTADPRVVPEARKLQALTWDQMAALAEAGAQVLQLRSVEHARDHGVRIHVRSSFSGADGTWIVAEGDPLLDGAAVVGVAHRAVDDAVARVSVVGGEPDGAAAALDRLGIPAHAAGTEAGGWSGLVALEDAERAVRCLHQTFELHGERRRGADAA
jgi:aspartate kinase